MQEVGTHKSLRNVCMCQLPCAEGSILNTGGTRRLKAGHVPAGHVQKDLILNTGGTLVVD